MINTRSASRRPLALAPIAALSCALLLLAGCGSDTSTASPASQPSTGSQNGDGGNGNGRAGYGGGGTDDPGRVSGAIAAIDGKTLQIQDGESQTAVTYSSKTTFSVQVKGTVSDIKTGECITVITSSTDEQATEVTATSVTAMAASDGQCGFGFGGGAGRGARPSGAPSGQPSADGQAPNGQAPNGAPSGAAPSGAPSEMPNSGVRPRSGTVTAVDGGTLTVAVAQAGTDDTTKITVKTTDDTTVTVTEKAKAAAAKVGMCATANGKADDTGAVAATRITLRDEGNDGCTMRRGNR